MHGKLQGGDGGTTNITGSDNHLDNFQFGGGGFW